MNIKTRCLPYCVSEHISIQRINNTVLYLDLHKGNYIKLPWEVHEWLISEEKSDISDVELLHYLNSIAQKLVENEFIVPDLTRINIGKSSIYVSKGTLPVQEKVDFINLYVNNESIIKNIKDNKFIRSNSIINFIGTPEKNPYDLSIVRRYIIDSISDIGHIKDIGRKEIRVEICKVPLNSDIDLLIEAISKYRVHFALPYFLDENISNAIFEVVKKVNDKNLTIAYDICCLYSSPLDGNSCKSISDQNNIEHQALKNIRLSCGAGINRFFVDSSGDIYPCYRMRFSQPIGNIFIDKPDDFLIKRRLIKTSIPKSCQFCSVRYFCSNGCKAEQNNSQYLYCQQIKEIFESELQR